MTKEEIEKMKTRNIELESNNRILAKKVEELKKQIKEYEKLLGGKRKWQ